MCPRLVTLCLAIGVTALALAGGPTAHSLTPDEQALRNAGIAIDGPGLVEFFRKRTPSDEEQRTLKTRTGDLASGSFATRAKATEELIRAGRASLPFLRDFLKHSDVEASRRALYCIQVIEQNTKLGIAATASRVLAERKPAGAVETLLAYLPFVDEGWVEEEVRASLKKLALADGKAAPEIERDLRSEQVKRRAAAAWITGASSEPRQRAQAIDSLTDASSEVRFLAAFSLLTSQEPRAMPVLIALLADASPEIARNAEELLFRVAGEQGPPIWLDANDNNQGKKAREAWESWWKANEAKIDWASVQLVDQALGMTLVAENQRPDGGGRLYECNRAGQIRWQVPLQNPIDAQWIPGGRILVADSRNNQVYEMDTRGTIGWKHVGINPTSVQRLPNGNIVVSTYTSIVEVTRANQVIFTHKTQGHTYHARKLADGHYLWIDACGELTEIDDKGTQIFKVKVGGGLAWGSAERLRNGRYLVALGGVGKVQEIDTTGKVYWERAVSNPNRAVRLANGHTLVASHGDACVYEFDAAGNERWKHACVGRPFAAHRR